MVRRREFVSGVVAASTVAVAGCTGRGETSVDDVQRDVITQYFNGVHSGDVEAVNEVLHIYNDLYPIDEETITQLEYYDPETVDTVEITGFDGMTAGDVAEWSSPENATEAEIEDATETFSKNKDSTLNEPEVDNHAYIVMSAEIGTENEEILFEVVQDYDNCFIWL